MIAACREMAPDFTLAEEDHVQGRVVVARCEIDGKPNELSELVGNHPTANRDGARARVAEAAMLMLQRRCPARRI